MDHLVTETRNPLSTHLDLLSAEELVRLMCEEDAGVPRAILQQAPAIGRVIEAVSARMKKGGRLIYCGAGTSGRLGILDATECPPTFNSPPEQVIGVIAGGEKAVTSAVEGAEDHPENGQQDMQKLALNENDSLVGIATSGRTPYVLGALQAAREKGALTVAFSCNPEAEINAAAEMALSIPVGPEILTGSTRLKAGTATKLVLNMISTGVMVALGKTMGNLMVDLRASNTKLRARANRIVRQFTSLDEAAAAELLRICQGELKTALVAHGGGVDPSAARELLRQAEGSVAKALEKPGAILAEDAELLLGIDGGGTKTVALLARRGKKDFTLLGKGSGPAGNPRVAGYARAKLAILEAVSKAFESARIPARKAGVLVAGLAGAGRAEEQAAMSNLLLDLAREVRVGPDAELVLAEGLPDGWGIAVIAGTGSMALGRNQEGVQERAGGWGSHLGDEGSAWAIGMEGLKYLTRVADGREAASPLHEILLQAGGFQKVEEVVGLLAEGRLEKARVAALAPAVMNACEKGDRAAEVILRHQGRLLAQCVRAVAEKLRLAGPIPLSFAGGLLTSFPAYRGLLLEALKEAKLEPGMLTIVHEPALGALRLAQAVIP